MNAQEQVLFTEWRKGLKAYGCPVCESRFVAETLTILAHHLYERHGLVNDLARAVAIGATNVALKYIRCELCSQMVCANSDDGTPHFREAHGLSITEYYLEHVLPYDLYSDEEEEPASS